MKEGDVVVLPMPRSDGGVSNRPAVVLREMLAFHDLLVCGVSTQLHQAVADFDERIASRFADQTRLFASRPAPRDRRNDWRNLDGTTSPPLEDVE